MGNVGNSRSRITGERNGRLVLVALVQRRRRGDGKDTLYLCRCDCGKEKTVTSGNFRRTQSCGCLLAERRRQRSRFYGMSLHTKALGDIWRNATCHARERGLAFSLTARQVFDVASRICAYCGASGAPFVGLDRRDNTRGYEPDNIEPCCYYCNFSKNNRSVREFLDWAKRVVAHIEADHEMLEGNPTSIEEIELLSD